MLICISCFCGVVTNERLQQQKDVPHLYEMMLHQWPEFAGIRNELPRKNLWPWRYIIIHHSATKGGNAERFGKYHASKGWGGLGYHFVIGNGSDSGDGEIEVGYRWKQQSKGAHAGSDEYNRYGIGVCLVGNFDEAVPTENQMRSLQRLVIYLLSQCGIAPSNILGHRDVRKSTTCPGKNFPLEKFVKSVSGKSKP